MRPVIAIVGRANVGKSTLFNRLAGKQVAIVEDLPGTTRDRIFADASLMDLEVTLVDTGGLDLSKTNLSQKVKKQVEAAIDQADLILFMVDVRDGLITTDMELADLLRKKNKPVILVANKADNLKLESHINDYYRLGFNSPVAISAHHNRGIGNLIDRILQILPACETRPADKNLPKLAIVGRPNVGKSMLLNTITGMERAIVDNVPGTTRDAIDTAFNYKGQEILLIDTAGIRRRGRSGTGIDYYSLIRSLRAINRCDVALLVVDAAEGITMQDMHIAGYIKEAFKGMVLVVNKCDLITVETRQELSYYINRRLKFMKYIPAVFISAKTGENVDEALEQAMLIWQERQKQMPDSVVNKLIKRAAESQAPPPKGLKRLSVIRAYQDGINPPSFTFLVNDPELVHFSYQRYLENKLREAFGFNGTSLRLVFKKTPHRKKERVAEVEN